MRREVFDERDGYLTVGEAGVTPERYAEITDQANKELDMLFVFDQFKVDSQTDSPWRTKPLHLPDLKKALSRTQEAVRTRGWPTVFFDNHDQPRVVSRWGDDTDEESRSRSAKALCLLLMTHRGTPYVYQGEELGMTNAHFTRLDQYRDISAINSYKQRVEISGIQSAASMLDALADRSRDNSRTPMQWDATENAGFMDEGIQAEPWIEINPNHEQINAATQVGDSRSVHSFFKRMIAIRQNEPVLTDGDWTLLDEEDEQVYAYTRSCEEKQKHALVIVNLSGQSAAIPAQTAAMLEKGDGGIIVSTHDPEETETSLNERNLKPWMGCLLRI